MSNRMPWWAWAILLLLCTALLAPFAFWLFVVRDDRPATKFGGSFFLTLDGEHPAKTIGLNDTPQLTMTGVSWERDCEASRGEEYLQFTNSPRIEVHTRQLGYPGLLGPIPNKTRWIAGPFEPMKNFTMGRTGKAKFWMHVVSTCWGRSVTTDTPVVEVEVVP